MSAPYFHIKTFPRDDENHDFTNKTVRSVPIEAFGNNGRIVERRLIVQRPLLADRFPDELLFAAPLSASDTLEVRLGASWVVAVLVFRAGDGEGPSEVPLEI